MEVITRFLPTSFMKPDEVVDFLASKTKEIASLVHFEAIQELDTVLRGASEPLATAICAGFLHSAVIQINNVGLEIVLSYHDDETEIELDVGPFALVPKKPSTIELRFVIAPGISAKLRNLSEVTKFSTPAVVVSVAEVNSGPEQPEENNSTKEEEIHDNTR